MTTLLRFLFDRLAEYEAAAIASRSSGDESNADRAFREGLNLAIGVAKSPAAALAASDRKELQRATARLALYCGEVTLAQQLVADALVDEDPGSTADEWTELRDVSAWRDEWLLAAVRRDPPHMAALDVLVDRTWKPLFGRCRLLTMDHHKAKDLAQQAWARVLRARHELKPGGNLLGYLTTIATNLSRDAHRAAQRAGTLAEHRLVSLNEPRADDGQATVRLVDALPDDASVRSREHRLLMLDLDHALDQLSPLLREVLVARFVSGESCASIGARHGRTEQTVSGWIRAGIAELKQLLEERPRATNDASRAGETGLATASQPR